MNLKYSLPILLCCVLVITCKAETAIVINGTVLLTHLDNDKSISVLVKIDDGVFQIDKIVQVADALVLHENVVHDVVNSALFKSDRKLVENSEKVLSEYSSIKEDIQRKIDDLKKQLIIRTHMEEQWVSYNMLSEGNINCIKYFIITLTDSDRTYGGFIYFVGPKPGLFSVKQLVPDIFSSMLSCEVLNLSQVLVFREYENSTIASIVKIQ